MKAYDPHFESVTLLAKQVRVMARVGWVTRWGEGRRDAIKVILQTDLHTVLSAVTLIQF